MSEYWSKVTACGPDGMSLGFPLLEALASGDALRTAAQASSAGHPATAAPVATAAAPVRSIRREMGSWVRGWAWGS